VSLAVIVRGHAREEGRSKREKNRNIPGSRRLNKKRKEDALGRDGSLSERESTATQPENVDSRACGLCYRSRFGLDRKRTIDRRDTPEVCDVVMRCVSQLRQGCKRSVERRRGESCRHVGWSIYSRLELGVIVFTSGAQLCPPQSPDPTRDRFPFCSGFVRSSLCAPPKGRTACWSSPSQSQIGAHFYFPLKGRMTTRHLLPFQRSFFPFPLGPELGFHPSRRHRFNSNVPPKSEASLHSKSVLLQDTPSCALASGVSTA
jgi:hypothetical protein